MKQLNRPKRLLLSYMLLFFGFVCSNAQDFEGVWYPSSDEGIVGNIKIKKENGEYVVQFKTTVGLKTSKGKVIDGALHFDFLAEKTYGQFWIGYSNGERDCIMVGKDYGYGSNGCASEIYDHSYNSRQKCATVEKMYWEFVLEPEGDNMALYNRIASYYCVNTYGNGERTVFTQSSNFVKANTYTNW